MAAAFHLGRSSSGSAFFAPTPPNAGGYARLIGRVGALAVALGVGGAVATGQGLGLGVARADNPPSSDSPSDNSSADTGDKSPMDNGIGSPRSNTDGSSAAQSGPDDDSSAPSADDDSDGDLAAEDETEPDDSLPSDEAEPPQLPESVDEPASTDETPVDGTPSSDNGDVGTSQPDSGDVGETPDEFVDDDPSSANANAGGRLALGVQSQDDDDQTAGSAVVDELRNSQPAGNTRMTVLAATQPDDVDETAFAMSTLQSPVPVRQPRGPIDVVLGLPAVGLHIATTVAATLLSPFFGTTPPIPVHPPVLWTVLAWVHRELHRTFCNHTPNAGVDAVLTSEDTPIVIDGLQGIDSDEGDTLRVTSVGEAAHGTVDLNANGTFTYTPDENYSGADSFTYSVSDDPSPWHVHGLLGFLFGGGHTDTGTVSITVQAVNDVPVAVNDTATVAEDSGPNTIAVLTNDSDVDTGQSLTVSLPAGGTQPAHGVVSTNGTTVTYTPTANFNGTDTFSYTVTDGAGGTATATVSVTVTAVNDLPIARGDAATVAEDSTNNVITVLTNDSDVDTGQSLTVSLPAGGTQPAHGVVSTNGTTVTYTPTANFNGTDTFSYTVTDGAGGTATATVSVTVTAVNDNPVAVNDTATVAEDSTNNVITVLTNDSDIDAGQTLTVSLPAGGTQPAHGVVSTNGATVTYTPTANFNGTDTFSYTVTDGAGGTATATVSVTVTAVNDNPVAINDTATVAEDSTNNVIAVLTNDSDVDAGQTLTVSLPAGGTQPAHGVVTTNGTTVTYTPTANYNGTDTFSYTITDGAGGSATATVSVTVTAVNDNPVAINDTATVAEDSGPNTIAVLTNDSDVDGGQSLTVSLPAGGTQPAHGVVSTNGTTVTYTPTANFNGTDTFSYTVSDGAGGTATATVSVTVTAVNDNPVAVNDTATVAEDSTNNVITVLTNDSDVDAGQSLTVSLPAGGTQPAHGVVSTNGTTVTYTPTANFNGTDTFSYTVTDGAGGTATATVSITVTSNNADPVLTVEPTTASGSAPANFVASARDDDGDDVTISTTVGPAKGTVTQMGNTFTYRPDPVRFNDMSGTDTFTITADDGQGGTASQVVTYNFVPNPTITLSNDALDIAGGEDGTRVYAIVATVDPAGIPVTGSASVQIIDTSGAAPVSKALVDIGRVSSTAGSSQAGASIGVSADGTRAYVANPTTNQVTVIDTRSSLTAPVVTTIDVGSRPQGVAVSANGNYAYVVNNGGSSVSYIDFSGDTPVVTDIPLGAASPVDVATSADGKRAFVSMGASTSIKIIDTSGTDPVVETVAVGGRTREIKASDDGNTVIVYKSDNVADTTGQLAIITRNTATSTWDVRQLPDNFNSYPGDGFIAISDDGKKAFVANHSTRNEDPEDPQNSIAVIDTATGAVTYVIVHDLPHTVVSSYDGSHVYVVAHKGGVYVIDTVTGTYNLVSAVGSNAASRAEHVVVSDDGTRVVTAELADTLTLRVLGPDVL